MIIDDLSWICVFLCFVLFVYLIGSAVTFVAASFVPQTECPRPLLPPRFRHPAAPSLEIPDNHRDMDLKIDME